MNIKYTKQVFAHLTITILVFTSIVGFSQNKVVGFRSSRLLGSYPGRVFPSQDYWVNTGKSLAAKFTNASPASVWIVGLFWGNGEVRLGFPSDSGISPQHVSFKNVDENEDYLTRFDQEGFNIWLQVEPGAANIDTLINLVMNRYKHHPCVKGFGIDVEWLNQDLYPPDGQYVSDSMAMHWEQSVKKIDTSYTLFLKHFWPTWMPPTYRGNILFVDDSQEFSSLDEMKNEFKVWGENFPNNHVVFQFGYDPDQIWWSAYQDPMKTIGDTLFKNIPNCYGLFWVDFTINTIYPVIPDTTKDTASGIPSGNLVKFTHWVATADDYGSTVDTGNSIMQNNIVNVNFKQVVQPNDSTWPWVELRDNLDTNLSGVTDIEVKYKCNKGLQLVLNQPPLDNNGESFYKVLPASDDWITMKVHVKDFRQPTWSQNLSTYDATKITSISFIPMFDYSVTDSSDVQIEEVVLYGYKGTDGINGSLYVQKNKTIINYLSGNNLNITAESDGLYNLTFYSIDGKMFNSSIQYLSKGNQTISCNYSKPASGIYLISVTGEKSRDVKKIFIK